MICLRIPIAALVGDYLVTSAFQHPAFLLKNNVFPPRLLIRVMYQYDFHRGYVRISLLLSPARMLSLPVKLFEDETVNQRLPKMLCRKNSPVKPLQR